MQPVLTATDSAKIDKYIIEEIKASSGLLMMENAARSIADVVKSNLDLGSRVLILCGSGNNGGDGFALARHLEGYYDCTIYFIGNPDKMSSETKINLEFAKTMCEEIVHIESELQLDALSFEFDCIVDSLIGVGGNENLIGLVVPLLQKTSYCDGLKIAVDVPTGINATSGKYHPYTFRADHTVTMLGTKRAFLNKELHYLTGDIHVADLAVSKFAYWDEVDDWQVEASDHILALPDRLPSSSKHSFGKIALIAGSEQYQGASAIAANAAVASGGGLVHLFTTQLHHATSPEVIPHILKKNDEGGIACSNLDYILKAVAEFDVVAIGPGIGSSDDTLQLVRELIDKLPESVNIILDADALRVLTSDSKLSSNIAITPHIGEFARILGGDIEAVKSQRVELAIAFAKNTGCTVLLKGSTTVVTNGHGTYFSNTGNSGLASGGTGDALTGIISAFIAKTEMFDLSVAYAAFIHGLAADLYVTRNSEESLTASKLIKYIGKAIRAAKNED